jgi:arabinofuranosyltransferase
MEPGQAQRQMSRADWLLLALGLALCAVVMWPFYGLTADDAFISFRYAMNWAAGCGPVYNCGQDHVEGYTNFLWMALSALGLKLGIDPVRAMRVLGALCHLATVVVLMLLCRRVSRSRLAQVLPIFCVALSPFFSVNAVTGLETSAATLSVALAALLSLELPEGRRPWSAGIAWGVSTLVRPEGLGLAALTGLWALGAALARRRLRQAWRGLLCFCLAFAAVAGPYLFWRLRFYGELLPNTYYAKRLPLYYIVPMNLELLATHALFFAPVLVAALAVLAQLRRGKSLYLLLLALALAAVGVSVQNNHWMPGHRLFLTSVALLLVVASGLADVGRASRRRGVRLAGPAVLVVTLVLQLAAAAIYYPETRALARTHYAEDEHPAKEMGLNVRKLARPGDWLAIRDAGMVPYYAGTKVNVLDMHNRSLNDRRITRHGWSAAYVMDYKPRFMVFASHHSQLMVYQHEVEYYLGLSEEFREAEYSLRMVARWHPTRHFFLFTRRP